MSTATAPLDLTGVRKVPLGRLTCVELRKMADTRAGLWLFATAATDERTFMNFMGITATPQGFLLPVLGILLVTSEWTQRTALVTFTLCPHRGKVILAKTLAALALGLATITVAVVLALLATLVGGAADPWQGLGADAFAKFVLLQVSTILQGLAFGLLFLNSAVAIVVFFILPTAFSIVSSLWGALATAQPWIDLGTSQAPLFMGQNLSNEQWAQLATGSALWIVVPFVVGLVRVLRGEVK
jgi:hypothetical protein